MALHETSRPESAGAGRSAPAPALDPGDRDRLLAGTHRDPAGDGMRPEIGRAHV